MPKISIIIPIHDMANGAFFLWRVVNSIMEQTFKNYEVIITKEGKMAENTNAGIKRARGELIKILYMDDWLSHPRALELMVSVFNDKLFEWMIVGTNTNPNPELTKDLETGNNKLGSPSALMFRNHFNDNLLFDEKLSWLLDCDLYKRMLDKYGFNSLFIIGEQITEKPLISIGIHDGQMTNLMSDDYKLSEYEYVRNKYNKN